MTKDDLVYINHILERSQKIVEFTAGMTESDFIKDEKTQSAVIRELEVIGEASKRISENYRNTNTNIPWKLMAGMRDVLIHDYEGVDALMVWDTIQKSVPELVENLKKVV